MTTFAARGRSAEAVLSWRCLCPLSTQGRLRNGGQLMQLHVVYTEDGVYLSKRDYPSWREIQDDFDGVQGIRGTVGPRSHG